MLRCKLNNPYKKTRERILKLANKYIREPSNKDLTSRTFFKIKIEDDEQISLSEGYKPTEEKPEVTEHGNTREDRQVYGVPEDYMVGKAEENGFLNSFLIGLQASGEYYNLSMAVLRAICAHVGREAPQWLTHALEYKHLTNNNRRLETPADFVYRVLYDDSRGEPEIEGRILCKHFSVNIYVLEADDKRLVTEEGVTSIADVDFHRPNTLYFINRGQYHYEPLVPVISILNPTTDDSDKKSYQKEKDSSTSEQSSSNYSSKSLAFAQNKQTPTLKNLKQQLGSDSSANSIQNVKKSKQEQHQALDHKDSTSTQPGADDSSITSANDSIRMLDDELITPELEQILEGIRAKSIPQLEAAFINHRSVLYKSTPDLHLITLSLKEALLSSDIQILDLVYEHWAAVNTSWLPRMYFLNLKTLTKALIIARDSNLEVLKEDRQVLVAAHCLIMYNNFRVELGQKLIDQRLIQEPTSDSNDVIDRQHILDILSIAIDHYKDYSDKNMNSTNFKLIDELVNESLTVETNTVYKMYLLYDMLELYYRKLNLCIAHLILAYLDSMEQRWKLPENVFQDIECALYYYINRVELESRLYVADKIIKHKYVIFEDFNEFLRNPNRVFNCFARYLEGIVLRKAIEQFTEKLKYPSMSRESEAADVDTLTLLLYLRDKFALEKMVMYLQVCSREMQRWQNKDSLLIVQRVLQVTCEFLKKNGDSLQLSPTTKALLQVHIPPKVFHQLKTLGECFLHVSEAKILRRIDLEKTCPNLYFEVAKDLDQIKRAIIEVVKIYEKVLEKFYLNNGLSLVISNINELLNNTHTSSDQSLDDIIQELSSLDEEELITLVKTGNNYLNERFPKYGFTFQHFQKLVILILHTKHLKRELHAKKMNAVESIIKHLPAFFHYIENILNDIELDLPVEEVTGDDIEKQTNLDLYKVNCLLNFLGNDIITFSIEDEGEKDLLKRTKNITGSPDMQKVRDMRKLIITLQREYEPFREMYELNASPNPKEKETYEYKGIEQFTDLLSKNIFLTMRDMNYLKENINSDLYESGNSIYLPILEKVFAEEEINIEEQNAIFKNNDMNHRCKAIIGNLVTGSKRDYYVLQYLAIRATALKHAFGGIPFTVLAIRYKVDKHFQLLIEALLQEIHNVFCECGLQHLLDPNITELLKYPLLEFLDLGNPISELVVENDSRLAIFFVFAYIVIDDEPVLKELWKLQEYGLDREQVKRIWRGPESPRLQDYFNLLPQKESIEQTKALKH